MRYISSAFAILCLASVASAADLSSLPNGSLLFYSSNTIGGRVIHDYLDEPTFHVAMVLDGNVYEAAPPRVRRTPIQKYSPGKATVWAYTPNRLYTVQELAWMRQYANGHLGQPYRLKNFFRPRAPPTGGTWCSRYCAAILNASRRYNIDTNRPVTPQDVFKATRPTHHYVP